MAHFDEERALTEHLIAALALAPATYEDPHAGNAPGCGVDVIVNVRDKAFGVQVTTPDFGSTPGADRASEAKLQREAQANGLGTYFKWVNANSDVAYNAFAKSIERKAAIAARHDFSKFDESWLLLACGVPTLGAVSTLLPPWVDTDELNKATTKSLTNVNYDRVFIHSILDTSPRLWMWTTYDQKWIKITGENFSELKI